MRLPRKIGDFTADCDITVEMIRNKKNHYLKETDLQSFLEDVEGGRADYDDLVLARYDYLDGGLGSVYAYLLIYDSGDGIRTVYAVNQEYLGNETTVAEVPIGEEERLLEVIREVAEKATRGFAES